MPVNNGNQHWVAAQVDIPRRHITIYDPDIKMTSHDWFQVKNARCLSVLFPYILAATGYYTRHAHLRKNDQPNLEPFKVTRVGGIPQQAAA